MKAWWKRLGALALVVTGGGLFAAACADNESSVWVNSCSAVTQGMCTATADPTAAQISTGQLDLFPSTTPGGGLTTYTCSALMASQLVARGNTTELRTETDNIQFYSADVTITDETGATLTRKDGSQAQFTTPTSALLLASLGGAPAYGVADILMLDSQTANDILPAPAKGKAQPAPVTVIANVVVHGRTQGGQELTTSTTHPFQLAISVCRGCLCNNPSGADCSMGSSMATMPVPDCEVGQDVKYDCLLLNGATCPSGG